MSLSLNVQVLMLLAILLIHFQCGTTDLQIVYTTGKQSSCAVTTGAAVDSWDRLRDGAVSCLMKLPSPLPGLETPEALLPQLQWACRLLRSPRVRESDAGGPTADDASWVLDV